MHADEAIQADRLIFTCGNGGSAAIANHLTCDCSKGIATNTTLRPRVVSLSATVEIMTAIANDMAYSEVFVYQLKNLARPGDVLITISSSGDSENIVRALGIGAEGQCHFGITEAEVCVVRIGNLVFKGIRIGHGVFAVGDNSDIFNAVTIKISGNHRRRKFCRDGKGVAKLLLYDRSKLGQIGGSRRGPRRGWRRTCLWRLRSCHAYGQQQELDQELHDQSLPLLPRNAARN